MCIPTSLSFKITKSFLGCMFMFMANFVYQVMEKLVDIVHFLLLEIHNIFGDSGM